MNYVKNEDDSVDFIISIRKDRNSNSGGCDECDLRKKCRSKQFQKTKCFIESLFDMDSEGYHIEIIT